MGESVNEGTVLEWLKNEGDQVEVGETLVEVSTDKVDAEIPSPASGTLLKIHAEPGETVEIGALLAEIQAGEAAATNGAPPTPEAAEGPAEIIDIVAPSAGESVSEGTLLEWLVKPGDSVDDGQTIVEFSTDKVDVELPAPASGKITELLADSGDTIAVGQLIARMELGAGAAAAPANEELPPASNGSGAVTEVPEGVRASPVAARVAAAEGVALGSVSGSGAGGRVTKADVLAASSGNGAAAPSAGVTELRGGAAMLARYMDESLTIPTATSIRTIPVTQMDGRRKELKEAGHKVSFTHLIAWAIARTAADQMPVMTHHFLEQDGKPMRADDGAVNLGIAVDVEKKDGSRTLMVPVITNAGAMDFASFKAAFDELIEKARTNTLSADDLVGANMTLTNPGGIGTGASVPRLMPGQGTIVATGSIGYPVGLENAGAAIGAEKVMTITSTYDHRVIQGAESGRFLQAVEAQLSGGHEFYDQLFASLGVPLGVAPQAPRATAPVAAAEGERSGEWLLEIMQAVQKATALVKAFRTHGHLAATLDQLGT